MEEPAPPADKEPDSEPDDQQADRRLRRTMDRFGEIGLEEDDRQAEQEQARRVAQSPRAAEAACGLRSAVARGDQRRHRREVVGIAGVAQAERNRDEDDDDE